MSFTDEIARDSTMNDYHRNFSALQALEAAGHKVEAKGQMAAYVDGYLMIFLYTNIYENHKIGARGEFKPGEIGGLL